MSDLKLTTPIDPTNLFGFSEAELKIIENIPALAANNSTNNSRIAKLVKDLNQTCKEMTSVQIDDLIKLIYSSNLSPIKCASLLGLSWSAVLRKSEALERDGNTELVNAIKLGKKAFAELIMLHPENYQGASSMAIFIAKSQAGWNDDTPNIFGVPGDEELDQILQAREELIKEYEELKKKSA